ncbi:MAG: bifunctional DNA primase/polymerase [Gemmatimonadota bacterium]
MRGRVARLLGARRYFSELGLFLTPVRGKGAFLRGWQHRRISGKDLDEYVRQGYGLGAVHGLSGTGAVDGDTDADLIVLAFASVGIDYTALLERDGLAVVGNPAKPAKLFCRVPEGHDLSHRALRWPARDGSGALETIFELRAGAVQDVLPYSMHPGTRMPYRFGGDPPASRAEIPLLPDSLLRLWVDWDSLRPAMEGACPWAPPEPEPAQAPSVPTPRRGGDGPSVIDTWNARVPVSAVLTRNGYQERGDRWLAPGSTTGDPGVVILDGRAYSHHASCPLGDGHAHDSFSVMTILEHGGDVREAARSARRVLGMDIGPRTRAKRARAILAEAS